MLAQGTSDCLCAIAFTRLVLHRLKSDRFGIRVPYYTSQLVNKFYFYYYFDYRSLFIASFPEKTCADVDMVVTF